MPTGVTPNLPRVIAERIVRALRINLLLEEDQCFLAAFAAPVEGAPHDKIIQVVPGGASLWEGGDGGQQGGNLFRLQTYTIAIYFTLATDPHNYHDVALVEPTIGILDFTEKVRGMLTGAILGLSEQCHRMLFQSESDTHVIDEDKLILSKTLTFVVPYAVPVVDDELTIDLRSTYPA